MWLAQSIYKQYKTEIFDVFGVYAVTGEEIKN